MRVLIVTPEAPTMLKVRVFRFARLLSSVHQVHIASLEGLAGGHASPEIKATGDRELRDCGVELIPLKATWCAESASTMFHYARGLLWRAARHASAGLGRRVRAVMDQVRPDLIHVDRVRSYPMVADWEGPALIDMTDPVGWYFRQRVATARLPLSGFLAAESKRMWSYERVVARRGRPFLFASEFGEQRFLDRCPDARTTVVPVPLPTVCPDEVPPSMLPGSRPAICFLGNLYYSPNVRGIEWFSRCCWPEIRRRMPGASLHIAGSHPAASVRHLESLDGVYLHPDPVRMEGLLRACDVAIAPLLLCSGFSNKIVDSAVLGELPVIASPAAQAGLPAPVREQLLCASSPGEWVEQVERLWSEPGLRVQRAACLVDAIRTHLSDHLVLARLTGAMEQALSAQRNQGLGRDAPARVC